MLGDMLGILVLPTLPRPIELHKMCARACVAGARTTVVGGGGHFSDKRPQPLWPSRSGCSRGGERSNPPPPPGKRAGLQLQDAAWHRRAGTEVT